MQTLVIVPAMIGVLRPVALPLVQNRRIPGINFPLRATYCVGRYSHGFPESAGHSVPVVRMR